LASWTRPPESYHRFLERLVKEIPEFEPVVAEQLALLDFVHSTSILDALSTVVMKHQARVLDGSAEERDREIVERWIALGESAMRADPYVTEVFLETAGDDLLFDPRGISLRDKLGPLLRKAIDARWPSGMRGSDQLEPIHWDPRTGEPE
jgi:hypothetical protein